MLWGVQRTIRRLVAASKTRRVWSRRAQRDIGDVILMFDDRR